MKYVISTALVVFALFAMIAATPKPADGIHITGMPIYHMVADTTFDGQFSATLKDSAGNVLTGRSIVWSSSNPNVATVNPETGKVTVVSPGITVIVATSGGVSGATTLTVKNQPTFNRTMVSQ